MEQYECLESFISRAVPPIVSNRQGLWFYPDRADPNATRVDSRSDSRFGYSEWTTEIKLFDAFVNRIYYMNRRIQFRELGLKDYKEAWDYQESLFQEILEQKVKNRRENSSEVTPNYLLFVEHPHVYTLGKSGDISNLLIDETQLKQRNATFYKINRGGDITYHGPGQVVGYPILDLENFFSDIHKYLRLLEEMVILTLAEYGVKAGRSNGETGVWIDADTPYARKICAMGVRASRWVTMHGFAFNVNSDLGYFDNIVPCGIRDKAVTSLHIELGVEEVDPAEVKEKLKKHFSGLFEAELFI